MVVFSTHKVVNSARYDLIIVDNKKKYPFELDILNLNRLQIIIGKRSKHRFFCANSLPTFVTGTMTYPSRL
ncbi:hypothetical protein GCM10007084_28760 [Parabacteroides faecis]|nr:hypothetical protein GCM10007084_28760 [Parabacteroides faecis]